MVTAKIIPSVKIKHAKGTTDNSRIWLDYWVEQTGENISNYKFWHCECCNNDVPINEMVGAHVVKINNSDNSTYIYPTCSTCNKTYKGDNADTKEFSVPETLLIPKP